MSWGLELTDSGFDHTVLSEFRARLVQGKAERLLLDTLLERLRERGLVKKRGRQRTDSTHILAAVRVLNRLERVGETLRATLNDVSVRGPRVDKGASASGVVWTAMRAVSRTRPCPRPRRPARNSPG